MEHAAAATTSVEPAVERSSAAPIEQEEMTRPAQCTAHARAVAQRDTADRWVIAVAPVAGAGSVAHGRGRALDEAASQSSMGAGADLFRALAVSLKTQVSVSAGGLTGARAPGACTRERGEFNPASCV